MKEIWDPAVGVDMCDQNLKIMVIITICFGKSRATQNAVTCPTFPVNARAFIFRLTT